MQRMTQGVRRALGLAIGLALMSTAAIALPGSAARSDREAAVAWAKAHRRQLPKTLAGVAAHTPTYRKAILNESSLAVRRDLWKAHLETFLLPDAAQTELQRRMTKQLPAPLSERQRTFVREAIDSLPSIFNPANGEANRAAAGPICTKGKAILPRATSIVLFGNVGPADMTPRAKLTRDAVAAQASVVGGVAAAVNVLLVKAHLRTEPRRLCDCHRDSICDCGMSGGCNGMCIAELDDTTCGCFLVWACTAVCTY